MMDFLARQTLSHLICLAFVTCVTFGRNYCDLNSYCDDEYYCCENNTQCCSNTVSVGAIIGIIIGTVVVIIVVVIVIVIFKKKQFRAGQVIQTQNTASVSTVQQQQSGQTMPMYTTPQNQGYPNHAVYPPPSV